MKAGKIGLVVLAVTLVPAMTHPVLFGTSDKGQYFKSGAVCQSCHNGMTAPEGEDASIGTVWRASMMANSARDPYWQAAVRREVMDHPEHQSNIEANCATCHMPMASLESRMAGEAGDVFSHLQPRRSGDPLTALALDGVSCTTCHQITDKNLGAETSFNGAFGMDATTLMGERKVFGPYAPDAGRSAVMHSVSGFEQAEGEHIQESALCATCHTLYTQALGPSGQIVGRLPEQVPYLEWLESDYAGEQSCQSCHMPEFADSVAITSVVGQPRENVSRHTFVGGNVFVLRMLNRFRADLGVAALPSEIEAAVTATLENLQTNTARLAIIGASRTERALSFTVELENLAGHKLPTGYPSRRAWIHVQVLDYEGEIFFESGKLEPSGAIIGNDNDDDASRYEPHYAQISRSDQVQIYESVMMDRRGQVTTGLLTATRYAKDNRLLPAGFDKAAAPEDAAVHGEAGSDSDFTGGGDMVTYVIDAGGRQGPFLVRATLNFQPIGYRWARNLEAYAAVETDRFVRYYDSMADVSSTAIVAAEAHVESP